MDNTPRTDVAIVEACQYFQPLYPSANGRNQAVHASFAASIERELNQLQKSIADLSHPNCQMLLAINRDMAAERKRDNEIAIRLMRERDEAVGRMRRLEAFARDVASNYDHDPDAHRNGTPCPVCEAEAALDGPKPLEQTP